MTIELSDRQKQILGATINHYIATAEPVGSKAIATEYNLNVSPATVRNTMLLLEKSGLLYQPHTSAGRVPSDSGYRVYVDELIQPIPDVARKAESLLSERFIWGQQRLEVILRQAAQLLSDLSGYITLITLPNRLERQIRLIQLVALEPHQVMVILVLDTYETQSALIQLDQGEEEPELRERTVQVLTNFLNHQLQGRSLVELSAIDWQKLDLEFQTYSQQLQTLLRQLSDRYSQQGTSFVISGLADVLQQPEFSQVEQVQMLLHLLEDQQDQLAPLISSDSQAPSQVQIRIGSENTLAPMQSCTLVYSCYCYGDSPVGSIGILGPTRMPYARIIPLVATAADYLTEQVSRRK
ncbi:heat-inducible transcriptional repressor HrcA [Thermosynechococcus sp. QKsg1]|uniref:heat-inducible transcriptional repressor HrcA n=1 Tax=unclassified Thermosynechococcus TaxID=2622553 RepID=UPI0025749D6D|nr:MULTISPECIES: heat-inducible transcriptional repressor HrcA [unclassified Thermosynechococcus]WJI23963.1 heat-inducible transcriptional repressor HrcA [Thermosynechococcus sp. B0]WNC86595.1 heat-inducible transcriptional repressor HrcA [Thermosynechococcus sp. QKsg1]